MKEGGAECEAAAVAKRSTILVAADGKLNWTWLDRVVLFFCGKRVKPQITKPTHHTRKVQAKQWIKG